MQTEVLKAKKLSSLGTLAGGIAHDFNNLLYVIVGNIDLAKDKIKRDLGILKNLQEVEKASLRASELAARLITFSKGGNPIKKVVPIGIGRILALDDEKMIRDLTEQMLSQFGYDAVLAQDGSEAIELYRSAMESGKPFDAVILDLTVKSGMGGKSAAQKLLEINPHVKSIVSSAYFNDPVMTDFKKYGFAAALPKPYMKILRK